MGKTKIFICIVLICCITVFSGLVFGVGVKENASLKISSEKAEMDFASELGDLIAKYEDDENEDYIVLSKQDDLTEINNLYTIDVDNLSKITNLDFQKNTEEESVSTQNVSETEVPSILPLIEDDYISVQDFATINGYNLEETEDEIVLSKEFYSKRLIVKSYNQIDLCGAIDYVFGFDYLWVLQYETEEETKNAFDYYSNCDDVIGVYPDCVVQCSSSETVNASGLTDSFSYSSWGAEAMGVDVYSSLLSSSTSGTLPEIVVAVLDSGLDSDHEWFNGRIADTYAKSFVSNSSTTVEWEDDNFHGTHVSGTIVDLTLPNVKILPIKVMNANGQGYTSAVLSGIEYVIKLKKENKVNVCVINLSLAGRSSASTKNSFTDLFSTAMQNGIVSVVASGNNGSNTNYYTPANTTNAIVVGAVEQYNSTYIKAYFSNYGSTVDVVAPGVNIVSAYVGGGTKSLDGTSMACPHVAAVAALLLSSGKYKAEEIESVICENTIDLGGEGKDIYYGYGFVDISGIYADVIPSVQFSVDDSGTFKNAFALKLISSVKDAQIYYTLDGTTPSLKNGIKYNAPITINSTTVVKAIAYVISSGGIIEKYSAVTTNQYNFSGVDIASNYQVEDGVLVKYTGTYSNLTIPGSVNGEPIYAIGKNVFNMNSTLEEVVLESEITKINDFAFYYCQNLKRIIASGVTSIGNYSFYMCSNLESITEENFPNLKTIGYGAFCNCQKLSSVKLNKILEISERAFYYDISLEQVELLSATIIKDEAFYQCSSINELAIPNVEIICNSAFYDCQSMTKLGVPSLISVEPQAFMNCYSLTNISAGNLKYIGYASFCNCKAVSEIVLSNAKEIGSFAFAKCVELETVTINDCSSIRQSAFYGDTKLLTLNAQSLEEISANAFYGCSSLTNLKLPYVESIGQCAFRDCTALNSIELSSALTYIGSYAFYGISTLEIKCYGDIPVMRDYESIASSYKFTYLDGSSKSKFEYEEIDDDNIRITGYKGDVSDEIVIPSYISYYTVKEIGDNAFVGYNITAVNLSQCEKIGVNAFKNCTNLIRVNLPQATTISDSAFSNCSSLIEAKVENVESFGAYCFYNCVSLKNLYVGENVSSMGEECVGFTQVGIDSNFVLYVYKDGVAYDYAVKKGLVYSVRYEEDLVELEFTLQNDGTYYVSGANYIQEKCPEISIPAEYNGKAVTGISTSAFLGFIVKSVNLPSSVIYIGQKAFAYCVELERINLENVKYIDDYAFLYTSLKQVYAPNLIEVGINVFDHCADLESVSANSLPIVNSYVFSRCYKLTNVEINRTSTIGYQSFYMCHSLSNINLNNVQIIYNQAFYNCINLKTVYMNKIQILYDDVFYESGVKKFFIGENLKKSKDCSYMGNGTSNIKYLDATIYGKAGTVAQTFATEYSINFEAIDDFELISVNVKEDAKKDKNKEEDKTLKLSPKNVTDIIDVCANGDNLTFVLYTCSESSKDNAKVYDKCYISFSEVDDKKTWTIRVAFYELNYYYIYFEIYNWQDIKVYESEIYTIDVTYDNLVEVVADDGIDSFPKGIQKVFDSKVGEDFKVYFSIKDHYSLVSLTIDGVALSEDEINEVLKNKNLTGLEYDYYYVFEKIEGKHKIEFVTEIEKFNISITSNEGGVVDNVGENKVDYNSKFKVTITPNVGYKVKSIIVDGSALDDEGLLNALQYGISFDNVVSEHSINVEFEQKIYTLRIPAIAVKDGAVSANRSDFESLKYGDEIEFTVEPEKGMYLKRVILNGEDCIITEENKYIYKQPDCNSVLMFEFDKIQYQINIKKVVGSGEIYIVESDAIYYGDDRTLKIVETESSKLSKLVVDGVQVDIDIYGCYLISDITNNVNVEVSFKNYYNLQILNYDEEYGSVKASKLEQLVYGEEIIITITPKSSYQLKSVYINNKDVTNRVKDNVLNFTQDNTNNILTVYFELQSFKVDIDVNSGSGNVTADKDVVEYGGTVVLTLNCEKFNAVDKVLINGKIYAVVDGKVTVENVTSDLNVEAYFRDENLTEILEDYGIENAEEFLAIIKIVGGLLLLSLILFIIVRMARGKR